MPYTISRVIVFFFAKLNVKGQPDALQHREPERIETWSVVFLKKVDAWWPYAFSVHDGGFTRRGYNWGDINMWRGGLTTTA